MPLRAMTVTDSVTLVTEECCSCGVLFAMTQAFQRECLDNRGEHGKKFYCPNGHGQWYTGKTDAVRARERADELARRLASREEDVRAARMAAEEERRRHAATKGQLMSRFHGAMVRTADGPTEAWHGRTGARAVRRLEAAARNASTPRERTAQFRRDRARVRAAINEAHNHDNGGQQ